jgi:hypothetical protein
MRRVGLLIFVVVGGLGSSPAAASGSAELELVANGLPENVRASVVIHGSGLERRALRFSGVRVVRLPPGRYSVRVKRVVVTGAGRGVREGAVAYPDRSRVRTIVKGSGGNEVEVAYRAVVNPRVQPLPSGIVRVIGDRADPSGVVLGPGVRPPAADTIYAAGPSTLLPRGLISKVVGVARTRAGLLVSLKAVPVTRAVPSLDYQGSIRLEPLDGGASPSRSLLSLPERPQALRSVSRRCVPPKLLRFKARLDKIELRQASLGAWPPQMRLTLAVRTTESLGVAAVAVGVNCDWSLANLGPYQAAIPVGPIVVPVYAEVPIKAGIHVNGRFDAATINVASTTVASAAAGVEERRAALSQEGSNVWTSGALSLSGDAKLYASVGVEAGIGVAKGANVHLAAGFGPEFAWSSGGPCGVYLNLGALSASVNILGKDLNTPPITPLRPKLWSGCEGGDPGGPGGGSGGEVEGIELHGLDLGTVPAGVETVRHLSASGGAAPYSFAVSPGLENEASVPAWVRLESDGALRIDPPPGLEESVGFYVYARDSTGAQSPQVRDRVRLQVAGDGAGDGFAWSVAPVAVPPGFIPHAGDPWMTSPACGGPGVCVLGGVYQLENGGYRSVLTALEGGDWKASAPPLPPGATGTAVVAEVPPACSSNGTCLVPGYHSEAGGLWQGLAYVFEQGRWTAAEIQLPLPPGSPEAQLSGLSEPACSTDGTCVIVVEYGVDGGRHEALATYAQGEWSAIEPTLPDSGEPAPGAAGTIPACASEGLCVAATNSGIGGWMTVVNSLEGGIWTSRRAPVPAGGQAGSGHVQGTAACSQLQVCVMSGVFRDELGSWRGMLLTYEEGAWSAVEAPSPPGGEEADPWGLPACSSDGTCVVAGEYRDSEGGRREMISTLRAGTWSSAQVPLPPGGQPYTVGISSHGSACSSGGVCVFGGTYDDQSGDRHGLLVTLADGAWRVEDVPVPPGGKAGSGFNDFAVACTEDQRCVLTGFYEVEDRITKYMLVTLAGGEWTVEEMPETPGYEPGHGSLFAGPACAAAGPCVVLGESSRKFGGYTRFVLVGEG